MDLPQMCQSCGLPLFNDMMCGTNQDGSKSKEYCRFCFQKGSFTDPNMSVEDMINKVVGFHEKMKMTEEQARNMAEKVLPNLGRWKKK